MVGRIMIAPNLGAATRALAIRLKRATRASAIRPFGHYRAVTPINHLLTPAWPAYAVLRNRSNIFNIPSKQFEFVGIASCRRLFAV